jgi:hypothetical protein
VGGLVLAGAAAAWAHVRLIHPSNGNPLWWGAPASISIVINDAGSDDLSDGSHETALRNAIAAWNAVEGTTAQLVEDASPAAQARTDWASDSIHLLYFDESGSSGLFPGGSSTVAITPVWFYNNGLIVDADVLFNGLGYSFTTSQEPGRFDVQDVAAHELGHLLGLDHTGWAGGTMYPYVDPTVILHRSLSQDETHGLRAMYPSVSYASITGYVKRSADASVVRGAHVVVRDAAGRTRAAGLTNGSGQFDLRGLDAGSYTLYTNPLDYPVSAGNLGSGWAVETDFEATLYGNVTLATAEAKAIGDLLVDADVALSLGRNSDRYPLRCVAGDTTFLVIRGSGLSAGSSLACSDPTISVTPTAWFGTQVSCQVQVPPGAAIGHADMTVTNAAGDRSILPAALEITPADPSVSLVSPNQGDFAGGTALTISGTDFNPGARVVFGGEIYEDGAPGGCTVLNSTTITLTTRPSPVGVCDVVVIDASGIEGRMTSAFQFLAVPVLQAVFPAAGSATGGTEVSITGANFDINAVVRINGVVQGSVFPTSEESLVVITSPGVVGGPWLLEVENPGGSIASSQFTYVNRADPWITQVTPDSGSAVGGDLVTITGSNFVATTTVVFGADPLTGLGGTPAADLYLVDSTTLEVTTPAAAGGTVAVMVADSSTQQADVLVSGFQFQASSSGGGGGGGCHAVPVQGPPEGGELLRALAFFLLLALGARCAHLTVRRGAGDATLCVCTESSSISRSPAFPGTRSTRSRAVIC